ncbi:Spore coat protein CotH [Emticicia oligotrophica DSM 17448]|uniref:Spore coat protein CotH n=1 Tax=Emticicia oligotrophica (strain DSM 17448 / CIP 109782 / MTCC 6937 / GPTSA100-15) TaxID=929562 RepID=A0ABN4APD3_EMTOG|nr:CotH kinase family protein [Emticicia oligotrophica]AFK04223.1 Spore coat protein CotH [Emticicia oligotrophica DSM 17448]
MKLTFFLPLLLLWGLLNCNNSHQNDNFVIRTPRSPQTPYFIIQSDKEIVDDPKRTANLKIVLGDSVIFQSPIGIELRGASSQLFYDKKSYGFELRNEKNDSKAASILNLSKNSAWILHGPYGDKTLLRNAVAYKLSNDIGRYASRTEFVEVEINGKFMGFYVLMEKLKQDNDRIKLSKLSKNDTSANKITGGYIIKIDKTAGNNPEESNYTEENSFASQFDFKGKITTQQTPHFLYEYPKPKNINSIQKTYIQNYIHSFEKALASDNFKDEQKGYRSYIDVDSFVDYFILTELFQNHDGYRLSTYLQKDRDKKLQMGPIWDIDIAFGSDNGFCDGMNRHAWVYQYNQYCSEDTWLVPFWWKRLITDEYFKQKLVSRWQTLRTQELSDNQLYKVVSTYNESITNRNMVARNFERWNILNHRITPNSTKGSHEKEISRMKQWLKEHAHWIDEKIGTL